MHKVITVLLKHPGFRLARYELGLYHDLFRWMRGDSLVPEGAEPLPHPPGRLQMLLCVIAILFIEMVVVHLLLPEDTVRLVVLLLSVWGVVYICALIASERIRPSYVADSGIVLRRGKIVFVEIPAELVAEKHSERTFASAIFIDDDTLTVGGTAGTDTLLVLNKPVNATGDRFPWQKVHPQAISRIRYYAGNSWRGAYY